MNIRIRAEMENQILLRTWSTSRAKSVTGTLDASADEASIAASSLPGITTDTGVTRVATTVTNEGQYLS